MSISKIFTDGNDGFTASIDNDYALTFLGGNDRLVVRSGSVTADMGAGADFIRLDGGSLTAHGQSGADTFNLYGGQAWVGGGAGNDLFNVGGGAGHRLYGASDDDRFSFTADGTSGVYSGGDGNDSFYGLGHAVSGTLNGGNGNDQFRDFTGGAVNLRGGAGNDFYDLAPGASPTIVELSNEGTDTVRIPAWMDYTLPDNVENLRVRHGQPDDGFTKLTGNGLDNHITAAAEVNTNIYGLAGNDTLIGGGWIDSLFGGNGDDVITGGGMPDYIETGAGHDVVVYRSVDDTAGGPMGGESIGDWTPEDRIDLSQIDANAEIAGFQHFTIVTAMGFPAHVGAGTIVLAGFGGALAVLVHTDSDGVPDMEIDLWSAGGESWLTPDNIII